MATKGSCMCGNIAFEYSGEPAVTALCHCTDCQKWTGAAYTSNAVVPKEKFKLTKGSPNHFVVKGESKMNDHFFCGNCGSSLYTQLEIMPDMVCVKTGTLDGGAAHQPMQVEFYTKDRVSYHAPTSQRKAFESE